MKIDFTNVPDSGSDPVPAGTYLVNITEASEEESGQNAKHPGTPYIHWTLVIAEGPFAGRYIWTNTSLHPDALQYGLKPLLKATEKFDVDGDLEFELEDVLNSTVGVKVNIQEQEGYDPQNNVRRFYTEEDARELIAKNEGSDSLLP